MSEDSFCRTGIVGARGYSGLELARLLLAHPKARLSACFGTSPSERGRSERGQGEPGWKLEDYPPEPAAREVPVLPLSELDEATQRLDVVFLATPAEASLELAPRLLSSGCAVIDLSGAFRLDAGSFKQWYGLEHSAAELLADSCYGLVPWAEQAPGARLVANPGCYATSVLMALIPLLREDLIETEGLVIDAKSGATGAGRKAAENLLFSEVAEDCLPYRVGRHQHLPEIRRYAERLGGKAIDPHFVTHLLPVRRGISSGIYARLRGRATLEEVQAAYTRAYSGYPLVQHGPVETFKHLSLSRVAGSPRTHLAYGAQDGKLYVFSIIDNLLKGAASQAIENLNRRLGIPPGAGLMQSEGNTR